MDGRCCPGLLLAFASLSAASLSFATDPGGDIQADRADNIHETPARRFERVQAYRIGGEAEVAIRDLDELRTEFPYDVDYALARAQILLQLHRDEEALDELAKAIELAPDYEAVWKLRFRVMSRQQGESAGQDRAAARTDAAERFPDALWWRSPGIDDSARWSLLFGASHETLSKRLPAWNEQFAEIHLERNSASRFHFRVGRNERGSAADTSFGFGAEHSLAQGWLAGIGVAGAGNPTFQPELGYSGYLGKSLLNGWALNLRYRRREYSTATVGSTIGTVEKYFGEFRVAYGLGLSRLNGASGFANHLLTINWYYDDKSGVGITLNTGKEAEFIGNDQVLETDVRGISLGGRRELNDRLGLQWWVGVHDQGDFYRRRFLGMAFSIRL